MFNGDLWFLDRLNLAQMFVAQCKTNTIRYKQRSRNMTTGFNLDVIVSKG